MKNQKLIAAVLALFLSVPCALANEPLKGGVEETGILPSEATQEGEIMDMPTPVLPEVPKGKAGVGQFDNASLKGGVDDNSLQGHADQDDPNLTEGNAQFDKAGLRGPLKGRAELGDQGLSGDDPDMDDQELQVAWDRWRNNFLYAVQTGVQESLNNPEDVNLRWDPVKQAVVMRFPLGTVAWFACKINNSRHIESVKIMHSSGFPGYDNAVLQAVKNLEGDSLLRFPKRSRRSFVTQSAGIKTSDSGGRQFFKFGDVERYRTGGQ